MSDYVPRSDAEFDIWQTALTEIIEPKLTDWGILADDFAALQTVQGVWADAFSKADNKQNRTSADVQAKNDARETYEKALRAFVSEWLAYNSKIADSDRERMGLTVKSDSRTPVAVPSTRPTGTIDFSVRLQHTIHFADEATPRSKAKPAGVHGCEIWMKVDGDPPKDASELTYLATDTRTPYVATFDGADAGKMVYYWLRWINSRSQQGPWSSTISAMIPA